MSQAQRILQAIQLAGDDGVENYKLAEIALKYSSRIAELRKDGYDIRQARIYKNDHATGTHVYYLKKDEPKRTWSDAKAIPWLDEATDVA